MEFEEFKRQWNKALSDSKIIYLNNNGMILADKYKRYDKFIITYHLNKENNVVNLHDIKEVK